MSTPSSLPPTAPGVVTKASHHSYAATLERLEAAIASKNLTLLARIDHSGEAARAGLKMQPAQVLIFGNPRAGTPLTLDRPLVALDLPLRVLVWADADGRVWLSYTAPYYLGERFGLAPELLANLAALEVLTDSVVAG